MRAHGTALKWTIATLGMASLVLPLRSRSKTNPPQEGVLHQTERATGAKNSGKVISLQETLSEPGLKTEYARPVPASVPERPKPPQNSEAATGRSGNSFSTGSDPALPSTKPRSSPNSTSLDSLEARNRAKLERFSASLSNLRQCAIHLQCYPMPFGQVDPIRVSWEQEGRGKQASGLITLTSGSGAKTVELACLSFDPNTKQLELVGSGTRSAPSFEELFEQVGAPSLPIETALCWLLGALPSGCPGYQPRLNSDGILVGFSYQLADQSKWEVSYLGLNQAKQAGESVFPVIPSKIFIQAPNQVKYLLMLNPEECKLNLTPPLDLADSQYELAGPKDA